MNNILNKRTHIGAAALVLALGAPGMAYAGAAFDANGLAAGGVGVLDLVGIDIAPDNVLLHRANTLNDTTGPDDGDATLGSLHTHGFASAFDTTGGAVAIPAGEEYTFVWNAPVVYTDTDTDGEIEVNLLPTTTDSDFGGGLFEIYYHAAGNANQVAGTGYDDGTLILQATANISGAIRELGEVEDDGVDAGGLDQHASGTLDNDGGATTQGIDGGMNGIDFVVTFNDTDFFITDLLGDAFTVDITISPFGIGAPYISAEPTGLTGAGGKIGGAAGFAPALGADDHNDIDIGTTEDLMGETDTKINFPNAEFVPEPASLGLLSLGLLALGGSMRRRRTRS